LLPNSYLINASNGELIFNFDSKANGAECSSFSPNSGQLAIGYWDNCLEVWDIPSKSLVFTDKSHLSRITDVAFSPDGRLLASASDDHTVRIWNVKNGKLLFPPIQHCESVRKVLFTADGRFVISSYDYGKYWCVWDISNTFSSGIPVTDYDKIGPFSNVSYKTFQDSPGQTIFIEERDDNKTNKEASPSKIVFGIDSNGNSTQRTSIDPQWSLSRTQFLLNDRKVWPWNVATGMPVGPKVTADVPVTYRDNFIGYNSDHSMYVVVGGDAYKYGTSRVYNTATGEPVGPALRHKDIVNHAAFGPNDTLATGTGQVNEGSVHLWNFRTGTEIFPAVKLSKRVNYVSFSPNGNVLVAGCLDHTAHILELSVKKFERNLIKLRHLKDVVMVNFDHQGTRIVTASDDRTARVWDVASGEPLTPALIHRSPVKSAFFSPDGKCVRTVSQDDPFRVWDSETGLSVLPNWCEPRPKAIAYGEDGKSLLAMNSNDTFQKWRIPSDRSATDFLELAKLYGGRELDANGTLTYLYPAQHFGLWKKLQQKYPDDFRVSHAVVHRWRENQITLSLKEGNVEAALFHHYCLIAEALLEKKSIFKSKEHESGTGELNPSKGAGCGSSRLFCRITQH